MFVVWFVVGLCMVVFLCYDLNFVWCFVMYVLLFDGCGYVWVGCVYDVLMFECVSDVFGYLFVLICENGCDVLLFVWFV